MLDGRDMCRGQGDQARDKGLNGYQDIPSSTGYEFLQHDDFEADLTTTTSRSVPNCATPFIGSAMIRHPTSSAAQ